MTVLPRQSLSDAATAIRHPLSHTLHEPSEAHQGDNKCWPARQSAIPVRIGGMADGDGEKSEGRGRYSAARRTYSPLPTGQAAHSSVSAAISVAISASVWTGEGVKRMRSVPRGTVG